MDQRSMAPATLVAGSAATHLMTINPLTIHSICNNFEDDAHSMSGHPRKGKCVDLKRIKPEEKYRVVANLKTRGHGQTLNNMKLI